MWLINSSIGRKVVMSVTGIALILFLTFHGCMNVVALFSGDAYNMICELLGANWYAVVATLGLAALAVCHIVYAFILTAQNRRARGNQRYEVTAKPEKVEWASQNMLVLGIIIVLGLLLHLFNFWYNMMFAELLGTSFGHVAYAQTDDLCFGMCFLEGCHLLGYVGKEVVLLQFQKIFVDCCHVGINRFFCFFGVVLLPFTWAPLKSGL